MTVRLPIGYHAIHPDVSLNFQMNRCFSWVGDVSMLDEMRRVAPRIPLDGLVNVLARRAAQRSLLIEWGLSQAMHVTGTSTPAAYLHVIQRYTAADISGRVTQDVLLLAGSEDHYVPVAQFYKQIAALTNTWSLTARLFTRAESAQNHCQVGNFGLALQVITAWLDSQAASAQPV